MLPHIVCHAVVDAGILTVARQQYEFWLCTTTELPESTPEVFSMTMHVKAMTLSMRKELSYDRLSLVMIKRTVMP